MSIPMIEKHTFGGNAFLQPSDYNEELIRDFVFQRERFSAVTELIHRLDRIDTADFAETTNKYLITAEHINDAYIAVLAIYWSISDKLENNGEIIMFDENEEFSAGGFPAMIALPAEMGGNDRLAALSNANNPVIHTIDSPGEISRDILLDNKVEFFVKCPAADLSGSAMREAESCCRCVSIVSDGSEDAETILTDYFWSRDYCFDDVQKEITSLARVMNTHDEYMITAVARKIVSNHLFNDPDDRSLTPSDFQGLNSLFTSGKKKKSSIKNSGLVGLEREIGKLDGILASICIDKMRFDQGISESFNGCSMVFAGPPGTAKTTLARLFASRLAERGIIKNASCFKECTKSDYVGQYVGHTAAKVDELFAQMSANGGGVIFFDEIYTLSEANSTSYDKEAVTCITQNMENYRKNVFCIFAGYENKMDEFLSCNPGLKSRMSFTVKFSEYSNDTLCQIFRSIAAADHYKIPEDCGELVGGFFSRLKSSRGEQFGNGREARNLFVNAKQKHAMRIGSRRKITSKMLTTLDTEDISAAVEDILFSELKNGGKRAVIGF